MPAATSAHPPARRSRHAFTASSGWRSGVLDGDGVLDGPVQVSLRRCNWQPLESEPSRGWAPKRSLNFPSAADGRITNGMEEAAQLRRRSIPVIDTRVPGVGLQNVFPAVP